MKDLLKPEGPNEFYVLGRDVACGLASGMIAIYDKEKMKNILEEAVSIIEEVCEHEVDCSCGIEYAHRGRVAPDCGRCNGPDYEQMKKWLEKYKSMTE